MMLEAGADPSMLFSFENGRGTTLRSFFADELRFGSLASLINQQHIDKFLTRFLANPPNTTGRRRSFHQSEFYWQCRT
jgi:hypothetical protein